MQEGIPKTIIIHKVFFNKKFFVYIIFTAIFIIASIAIYLEHSYQKCHSLLSDNFIKNMTSFDCFKLEEVIIASKAVPYANYSNVFEIERDKIGTNNGVACSELAFVATDLPKYAKDYVAYHEFLHTQSDISETLVNIKAGLKKPLGLIQTITYSLQHAFLSKSFNRCDLAGLWKIFKVYFLNDSFEDFIEP